MTTLPEPAHRHPRPTRNDTTTHPRPSFTRPTRQPCPAHSMTAQPRSTPSRLPEPTPTDVPRQPGPRHPLPGPAPTSQSMTCLPPSALADKATQPAPPAAPHAPSRLPNPHQPIATLSDMPPPVAPVLADALHRQPIPTSRSESLRVAPALTPVTSRPFPCLHRPGLLTTQASAASPVPPPPSPCRPPNPRPPRPSRARPGPTDYPIHTQPDQPWPFHPDTPSRAVLASTRPELDPSRQPSPGQPRFMSTRPRPHRLPDPTSLPPVPSRLPAPPLGLSIPRLPAINSHPLST